ncbi:MAG: LLM class flavin-dependent oxidoreductase [Ilumatobacteraceae bacterium]|nr:LLM class flavin-dependent oxidoreductase [Ilumatobacteraceae bacterium]
MIEVESGRRIYGIQLPIQAQSTYFVADWERHAGPGELAKIAQVCDNNDYGYVGVCDHIALPESVANSMGTHWMDPISTLSWLAALTSRVGLLTHVYVLPYRHPLMAAKQFANLDYISNGRAICGVGAGHAEAEFAQLGVDFHARGKSMNSSIPDLAEALEHEFVNGFGARPRPVQTPRPPIWAAGSSSLAIKRAARLADGWLPQGPSSQAMVDALSNERHSAGRTGPFVIGHITPFLYVGTPSFDVGADTISGLSQSIAERILAGAPRGVNQLQVRFRAQSVDEYCDQLVAFATEVAPLVTTI